MHNVFSLVMVHFLHIIKSIPENLFIQCSEYKCVFVCHIVTCSLIPPPDGTKERSSQFLHSVCVSDNLRAS